MASTLATFESSGFLPVGTPKTLVYSAPVDNEEALHRRIVDACQTIGNYPEIFERMRRSMMRSASGLALNLMEDILSTFYKSTLSAVTHKLNVSGHMLTQTLFLALVFGIRAQNLSAHFSYTLYSTVLFWFSEKA
jgi:hypothetical protein